MSLRKTTKLGFAVASAALLGFAACDKETIIEQPRDVSVTVAPEVAEIEVGGTVQLVAVVHNSENQNVTWASAASNIATVSTSGLVTGVAPGTAVITATSAADPTKKATATIEVKAPDPGAPVEVTIVPSEVSDLMVGETVQLVAVVKNASNQAVTWSSSAEAIATVSESGLVTAVAPGIAVITATSVADPTKKAAASIRVNAPPPLVLTLTPESAEIKPGETLQLVATVSDGSAVTFSSSAENVATVDESGLVTGVAPGTAVITAAAVADPTVRKTAAITVVAPVEPTVQIKSITQGDLTTPVNPNNVSGQMAITLNVDAPAGSGVSAVQLFIDDVLAGEQTFTAADGGDVEAQAAEIVFIVDTDNYDNETGEPAWLNGARTVSAVLAGQDGAVRASTSQQLTFNNPDGFHAIVEIKKDGEVVTATDANGLTWISGDVIVTLLPVMYSGREIASVTVGFNGAQQTATSAPFQVTFAANAGAPGTGANAVIGGAPGARPVVIASLTTQGQPGPAGFGTFRNASDPSLNVVRLDNRPPTIASFTLRTQADAVDCCVDGWVGPDYDFTDQTGALTGVGDAGVGRVTDITYYAALASVAATPNQVVAIGDVITTGDDLPETEFNNVYRVAVYLCDALLNCAAYELDTLIGVDKTAPPDLEFDAGTVADEAINPPTTSEFIIAPIADDYASGYGPNSLLATLVFNFGEACVIGTGDSCAPADVAKATDGYSGVFDAGHTGEGYYTFTAFGRDKAGNRTNTLTRTVLRDTETPVFGNIIVPVQGEYKGGEPLAFSVLARDNVDLLAHSFRLIYNGIAIPFGPFVAIGDGVGFNAERTTEATLEANYPYMRTVEPVDGADAPSGTLVKPGAAAWYVVDVAGNIAYTDQALADLTMEDGVSATTFGVTTFTVELNGSTLSARARGNTGNWANPYAVVHFYAVDGDGIVQYVGSATGATLGDDGGIRTYTWKVTYNAADFTDPVANLFAIAVTSAGDGLMSDWITP